jgi:carboxypeptidase C (cathepsin A)
MADCSKLFATLLGKNYRLLFYTGNFDTACGYQSTEEILSDLKKWGDEEDEHWLTAPRRIWTQAQGNPKGFVRQYRNLTQVSVPHSGHQVPAFQPQICREMIYNWIFKRPFPGYDPRAAPQGGKFSRWKHSPRRAR